MRLCFLQPLIKETNKKTGEINIFYKLLESATEFIFILSSENLTSKWRSEFVNK